MTSFVSSNELLNDNVSECNGNAYNGSVMQRLKGNEKNQLSFYVDFYFP